MKSIDARGLPCPKPVIEAKKALQVMDEKELQIFVDNPIAVQNLEKLGSYMSLKTVAEKLSEHDYSVYFCREEKQGKKTDKKTDEKRAEKSREQGREQADRQEGACVPDSRDHGKIVVISADHMGEGDEVLGRILMKGFLYALTELERLPETILLYNGGAKLSVEGSDSLEDLKHLEAQGVEIITCGTCLNHYGIADKLAVGRVTNMYEIAEKMVAAGSVVKP
ncbi:sulfurtransferase-like selenium metabolism protein YedF [Clostridium sp. AM58-1XD]|uniref:sulfurtransferase-like selenium metabolism protein YedF n=1 Tax=Clostridium sp. AM58-1XD TaxID=2292307 RepID=UPI000E4C84FA|nr:sulfurtransferase-like selenium metabolism protein YedF [Clostridium sp. AM58-1XD]RGY98715.1 sulfurtransferase-like selenium metabolism protein YedF [Clostridium sp. AM58-1XD]